MQREIAGNHRQCHGIKIQFFYNRGIINHMKEEKKMKKKLLSALLVAAMFMTALDG